MHRRTPSVAIEGDSLRLPECQQGHDNSTEEPGTHTPDPRSHKLEERKTKTQKRGKQPRYVRYMRSQETNNQHCTYTFPPRARSSLTDSPSPITARSLRLQSQHPTSPPKVGTRLKIRDVVEGHADAGPRRRFLSGVRESGPAPKLGRITNGRLGEVVPPEPGS